MRYRPTIHPLGCRYTTWTDPAVIDFGDDFIFFSSKAQRTLRCLMWREEKRKSVRERIFNTGISHMKAQRSIPETCLYLALKLNIASALFLDSSEERSVRRYTHCKVSANCKAQINQEDARDPDILRQSGVSLLRLLIFVLTPTLSLRRLLQRGCTIIKNSTTM